jgi:hypothetical protein
MNLPVPAVIPRLSRITARSARRFRTSIGQRRCRLSAPRQRLDEFLADRTEATNRTKYIYRLVIENKLKPFFGKIRAAKLTTQHTRSIARSERRNCWPRG